MSCWESSCQLVVEQHQVREGRHREDLARNRLARSESCRISERAQVHLQSLSLSRSKTYSDQIVSRQPDINRPIERSQTSASCESERSDWQRTSSSRGARETQAMMESILRVRSMRDLFLTHRQHQVIQSMSARERERVDRESTTTTTRGSRYAQVDEARERSSERRGDRSSQASISRQLPVHTSPSPTTTTTSRVSHASPRVNIAHRCDS